MKNVGYIFKRRCHFLWLHRADARGSGVSCDIRKLYPYEVYSQVQFDEIIEAVAIVLPATGSHAGNAQSLSIIEQLIDNIPEGISRQKQKQF
jgi:NADH-quinone oxidoreductase subunit D/NADH-quinone oxidoreductase subunit C/D